MLSFEVRRNRQTPNDVKLNVLQNGYLGFLMYIDFEPQNLKFHFFPKTMARIIQNFQVIKNRIHLIEIHTNNTHAKFQSNIFVFDCTMAKKQIKVMTPQV